MYEGGSRKSPEPPKYRVPLSKYASPSWFQALRSLWLTPSFTWQSCHQNEFPSPQRRPLFQVTLRGRLAMLEGNACLPRAKIGFGKLASVALMRQSGSRFSFWASFGVGSSRRRTPESSRSLSIGASPSPPATVTQEFFQECEELPGPSCR